MSPLDDVGAVLEWLINRTHLLHPSDLPAAADEAVRRAGGSAGRIYLLSRDQRSLVLLTDAPVGDGSAGVLSVEGTVAGRAFRTTEAVFSNDGARVWIPLLDGTERLGVLEIEFATEGQAEGSLPALSSLATLIAELVVSKGQYTDTYEQARRALPMGVASELLWRQLPPLTFATDRLVITAQLEPWNEVGGDAFDYSVEGPTLRFAVFDGMGHGLSATLLASVALAAYRNARRSGTGLQATARAIDDSISTQFGADSFVTGVLAELDTRTGVLTTLCAAHPAPLLVRDGKAVGELVIEPGVPFGFGERQDTVQHDALEPGDRVLLFSDGVIEARSPEGEFFGTERLLDLLVRQESLRQPPPETLRRLILAVLEHQQGALQDDATLLLVEWSGNVDALTVL